MADKQPSELALKLAGRLAARAKLQPAERAALAYARWQGMTDEEGLDPAAQKAELDRLVDAVEPEQWQVLQQFVGDTNDRAMKGVLLYSLERSREQARENLRVQEQVAPAPQKPRTKPRGRSM